MLNSVLIAFFTASISLYSPDESVQFANVVSLHTRRSGHFKAVELARKQHRT